MSYTTRTPAKALDLIVGIHGQRMGLLVDDVETFTRLGGTVRPATSGSGVEWAVTPEGAAFPVTCGDIVERWGEDGPYTDRCGAVADADGACAGHGAARDTYRAMSEAERAHLEREEDAWR